MYIPLIFVVFHVYSIFIDDCIFMRYYLLLQYIYILYVSKYIIYTYTNYYILTKLISYEDTVGYFGGLGMLSVESH